MGREGGELKQILVHQFFSAMIDAFYFQKSKDACPKQKWYVKFQQNKTLNPVF